jgi:5,10-methylenetetrahydrofolate reductase
MRNTYTDFCIPDNVTERLKAAGNDEAQKKEGLAFCIETIKNLKKMDGLRGIHIFSGGKEKIVPEIFAASGL